MARQELAQRQPGMMTLISVAISAAYLYSIAIFFFPPAAPTDMPGMVTAPPMMDFFWNSATLIAVMLLGHWIELRSVGQAQGALRELAKLLPIRQNAYCLPAKRKRSKLINCVSVTACSFVPGKYPRRWGRHGRREPRQ